MVTIDPQVYYDAATVCRLQGVFLAGHLNTLRSGLSQCGGMGGDYSAAQDWCAEYDARALRFFKNADLLANALVNFSNVIATAGYNWDVKNYDANMSANRGTRPTPPTLADHAMYAGNTAVPPTAVGANGNGLDSGVPGLLEAIGISVPNGDTGKLSGASGHWTKFSGAQGAGNLNVVLGRVHDTFDGVQSDDAALVQKHLGSLKTAAQAVSEYAGAMATPVSAHSSALGELRTGISSTTEGLIRDLAILAAATVIAEALVTIFSFGIAAAGPDEIGAAASMAEGAAMVVRAGKSIKDAITVSRLLTVVLGVGAAAGAAFAGAHGLTATSVLAHIAAMTVENVDEDAPKRRYVPNPKHDPSIPHHGRRGTPMDLTDQEAQQVLEDAVGESDETEKDDTNPVYGYKDGKLYEFRHDNSEGWHGYPVAPQEVPNPALKRLFDGGFITKPQLGKWRH